MTFDFKYSMTSQKYTPDYGQVVVATDGGFERGYDKGYADGETAGYTKGYGEGETAGYNQGNSDGYETGYTKGNSDGYAEGYETGYAEGVESSEVYYSEMGQMYTPVMIIPQGGMRYNRDHFQGANKLVKFIQQYGEPSLDSGYGLFSGCTSLEEVWVARSNFERYCFRMCTSLKKITLGRVGLAVTKMENMYSVETGKVETITVYVNAETISEIPTSITSNIIPYMSPNATVIYRNSTTGEVITE